MTVGGAACAAPPPSFVYCLNRDGVRVFAGRQAADGNLAFGLSVWSLDGHNISVFGVAPGHDRKWQFAANMQADTAAQRCKLYIVRGADDTLRVTADPDATCQSRGGVNTEIGTVLFPRTALDGTVTTELDNAEAFQKAGKCGGATN